MQKPISPSLIYRKISTTSQVPVAFGSPTAANISQIESTVEKIFSLILLDN
jgi:hypothetical protein